MRLHTVRGWTPGLFILPQQASGQKEVRVVFHQHGLHPLLHPNGLQALPQLRARPAIHPFRLPERHLRLRRREDALQ
jgi:hypothetical protein